jgi:hypothetical protein
MQRAVFDAGLDGDLGELKVSCKGDVSERKKPEIRMTRKEEALENTTNKIIR